MPNLTRFEDWPERLAVYLDRLHEEPFAWGKHDCILFTAGAIKTQTGVDLAPDVAGTYSTKLEACKVLKERFSGTLARTVTDTLGEPVHVAMAGSGDIVRRNKALGVCAGAWTWFVGETPIAFDAEGTPIMRHGLVPVPTLTCHEAWKIAPVVTTDG